MRDGHVKDAAQDVAEDVTQDLADDGSPSVSGGKITISPVAYPQLTQPFRGQKERYAAARGDPDASPTPDKVRSAAEVAFEPKPNTRVPPPHACP